MLAFPEDAEHLASFMLSLEIGRLHDRRDKLWELRDRPIEVSDEEEAQISRRRYLLGAGVKEEVVQRAADWPGATACGR